MYITADKGVKMAPFTCDFLFVIVVVAGGEQVTENESRDVHLLVLVLHHRYSFTIVPDRNSVGLTGGGRTEGRDELQRLYEQNLDTGDMKQIHVQDPGTEPQCFLGAN